MEFLDKTIVHPTRSGLECHREAAMTYSCRMFTDLPVAQLFEFAADVAAPADFDEFWSHTIEQSRAIGSPVRMEKVDTPLRTIDVFDVTFSGFGGQPIRAWLKLPRGAGGPLPLVIEYTGANGGRGHAIENLLFASSGYAHFHMDNRGQGSGWSIGSTADEAVTGPHIPGTLTRGIQSRESYYYRRLITDAVLAVEVASGLDGVDSNAIGLNGVSQGGGLALAVSGLVEGISAVVARVPFLSDIARASTICDLEPYRELADYLATRRDEIPRVYDLLAYFDAVNFSKRATATAHFSVALMDPVCPPSTVFAAFNAYAAEKTIDVWPYNAHEGGQSFDDSAALRLFDSILR
jgi:cephalosporin-C deacetylase